MAKTKNRNNMQIIYNNQYKDIPRDYAERLEYMIDKYNVSNNKMNEILERKEYLMNNISFSELKIILYEEPTGAYRPRFRVINRKNLINEAIKNPQFVHVYQPQAHDDYVYLKRLIQEDELISINHLLCTPCIVRIDSYFKTPENYNVTEKFLAEYGLDWSIKKPDWDNIGKKYSDMFNYNVWLDDTLTISGTVNKFYSILPRVEVNLLYMNNFIHKKQLLSVINRSSFIDSGINHNNFGYL